VHQFFISSSSSLCCFSYLLSETFSSWKNIVVVSVVTYASKSLLFLFLSSSSCSLFQYLHQVKMLFSVPLGLHFLLLLLYKLFLLFIPPYLSENFVIGNYFLPRCDTVKFRTNLLLLHVLYLSGMFLFLRFVSFRHLLIPLTFRLRAEVSSFFIATVRISACDFI
jgi:hypothetical protein